MTKSIFCENKVYMKDRVVQSRKHFKQSSQGSVPRNLSSTSPRYGNVMWEVSSCKRVLVLPISWLSVPPSPPLYPLATTSPSTLPPSDRRTSAKGRSSSRQRRCPLRSLILPSRRCLLGHRQYLLHYYRCSCWRYSGSLVLRHSRCPCWLRLRSGRRRRPRKAGPRSSQSGNG